jgi:hypothetical protein
MKVRKEVHIDDIDVILPLQDVADKKKWSLKKYMEIILQNEATRIRKKATAKEKV